MCGNLVLSSGTQCFAQPERKCRRKSSDQANRTRFQAIAKLVPVYIHHVIRVVEATLVAVDIYLYVVVNGLHSQPYRISRKLSTKTLGVKSSVRLISSANW